jgi:hypothetical protein
LGAAFNGWAEGRLIAFVEEVGGYDRKDRHGSMPLSPVLLQFLKMIACQAIGNPEDPAALTGLLDNAISHLQRFECDVTFVRHHARVEFSGEAFGFGLVHGFGFAYGLKESLQFAGRHLLVSLFSFNVGIEIGQVLVLAVMLPLLSLLLRSVLVGRIGIVVLSAVVAHVGWHWMVERGDVLWKVDWPRPDQADLAMLARWVAALLLLGAAGRFIARRTRVGNVGPEAPLRADRDAAVTAPEITASNETVRQDRLGAAAVAPAEPRHRA